MKLEVVVLGVSDVDRAKAFYENLGWRLDIDVANGGFRGVQGYTTNLPLADVRGGKAWVVDEYDGRPLAPEHGGPARLLVPCHRNQHCGEGKTKDFEPLIRISGLSVLRRPKCLA